MWEAKQIINDDPRYDHAYLPISGDPLLLSTSRDLIFSSSTPVNLVSIQTLGGTGANHLGALLICRSNPTTKTRVWISDPTWTNHHEIWDLIGAKREVYPYFDPLTKKLDFNGMMTALERAEKGDVVLLHACCHNPTGVDPTKEQWIAIADLMARRGLIPFLDAA
jgi:aspartate aminotransferase, cytoplasmic